MKKLLFGQLVISCGLITGFTECSLFAKKTDGYGIEASIIAELKSADDILEGIKMSKIIQLPPPSCKSSLSIEEAIKERRSIRSFKSTPLSIADIAQLLWAAQGITHDQILRAAPSAGALYPLELYLVTKNVTDLPAGIYKYNVQKHALEKYIEGDFEAQLCPHLDETQAVASIVICGVYKRIAKKYGENDQFYTHMEVGCVAENVHLQALSRGIGTVLVVGFDADVVKKVLNVPFDEQPLCILPLGKIQ